MRYVVEFPHCSHPDTAGVMQFLQVDCDLVHSRMVAPPATVEV